VGVTAAILLALLSVVSVGSAAAAPSKARLGRFCTVNGTGGGECGTAIRGLAVNSTGAGGVPAGSVYVVDSVNNRMQQFSADGSFIRAFGKEVDQATGGDVCTALSGDICKAGVAGEPAGSFSAPQNVAVDQSTGAVYVSDQNNRRVDVFSATGSFEGAIGWNVNLTNPAEEVQFCTVATGCKAGVAGGAAGQLSNLKYSGVAVDPRDSHLYVADLGNLRLAEYAISTDAGGAVVGASFVRALGWKVDAAAPAEELQECTVLTGCQAGTSGGGIGQFVKEGINGTPGPIAVDSDGYVYAISKAAGTCSIATPCRISKFSPTGAAAEVFGPTEGACQLTYTAGTGTQQSAFDIAVDPVETDHDNHVFVAKKVSGTEYRVYELDGSGNDCVASPSGPPLAGTATVVVHGLAVGPAGRVYVTNGVVEVVALGEAPPAEVAMTEVGHVGGADATFVGQVTSPAEVEGQSFPATWHFQYSIDQSHWTNVPIPDRHVISGPGAPETVEESVAGLVPSTPYFARLCATTGPTVCSSAVEFSTAAIGPAVLPFSAEITQTEATLGAEVDPNNLATRYHVEWATQGEWEASPGSYGHRLPSQDRQIGSGSDPVIVREQLGGLSPATPYHFRVVATNAAGTTAGPDRRIETLNACGFTDGRCLELVSRADKGPLASPGMGVDFGSQIQFQAASRGSGLAYTGTYGYPDATAGDASVYLARRGSAGWSSEQLSPPTLEPPLGVGILANNSSFKVLASDLGCGVVSSIAPLVPEAPTSVVEAGGSNLYVRDNATGSYRLVTYLPPAGPPTRQEVGAVGGSDYEVVGTSPDCGRVVFRTIFRYPGIPAVAARHQLYEWNHGTLRNVATIPGPGGASEPVPAESLPGSMDENPGSGAIGSKPSIDYWRSVSEDGSRSVFTAVSRFGGDSGKRAVFLRDAGIPAVLAGTAPATDISQSETATPNDGNSRFWTASVDGARVFFTARYGLAGNGSSAGATSCANAPRGGIGSGSGAGCDLYEYDLEKPAGARLTDLTPDATDARGAGVVGVLDASEDGSSVYFAARGRLGGSGQTEAENLAAGTYNVYLVRAGSIQFVGSLGEDEALDGNALVSSFRWTSRASTSGDWLAFESALGVAGEVPSVYLFSAADDTTVCASCRHDGRSPFSEHDLTPILDAASTNPVDRMVQPTVLTDNGRLYFYSFDPLAAGSVEGDRNLYQWEKGQVSLIASEPAGVLRSSGNPTASFFGGSDADGSDVYFATPQRLIAAAPADGWNVYDARVGGGFPEAATPAPPCDAGAEGACNAGGTGMPAPAAVATSTFVGPHNPPAKGRAAKRHRRTSKHHKRATRHHKTRKQGKRGKKKRSHEKYGGKRRAGENAHEKTGKTERADDNRRAAR
jgi:hypothetical protein